MPSSSSASTSTNPKRPVPDDINPETKRQKKDDQTQADEDWFNGNICAFFDGDVAEKLDEGRADQVASLPRPSDPRVSTVENADKKDANPPLQLVEVEIEKQDKALKQSPLEAGKSVIYWMRMNDLRLTDNHALSLASSFAQSNSIPLVVLFVVTPREYKAHDRSPRRIDFLLRNLRTLQSSLSKLNIPLLVHSQPHDAPRKSQPMEVLKLAKKWGAGSVWSNLSYEVDELERDLRLVTEGSKQGVRVELKHDRLVVKPGGVKKKTGGDGMYNVFTPFYNVWSDMITSNPSLLAPYASPKPNDVSALKTFGDDLKAMSIPTSVKGFELDEKDAKAMKKIHPEGEEAAVEVLNRFLTTKARSSQLGTVSPIADGAEDVSSSKKDSRLGTYGTGRDHADKDTTSRLSPYFASGVISARQVLAETARQSPGGKLPVDKKASATGTWVSEIAWREFYNHIIAAYPRVSMGQPFNVKYRGVQWETDPKYLQAWKEGKAGYPIVDAAMRQCNAQGWMHNRCRMIAASFLTKDLMLDWRLGERYFMTQFVDGDLAANNGGWQWVASTGTDPQPYFRIFNPLSQSEKADPSGDYIRYFVPELKGLKGKDLLDPHGRLSPAAFKALGYPAPIVDHKKARERALGRYKNIGEKPDEA
ncbi:DNA photolyase, FAD-binding/Cryptochrome [Mrakia frigida]|uniref:cryptochrome/photolyase family protein n=1 Tax=Mrakia frigida TaxID=29902 RepID=UPI003FCC039C